LRTQRHLDEASDRRSEPGSDRFLLTLVSFEYSSMTPLWLMCRHLAALRTRIHSSMPAPTIDAVLHLLARPPPRQVRLEHVHRALPLRDHALNQVRREQNIARVNERVPRGQRLRARDIERGARERFRVDRVAAPNVHEHSVRTWVGECRVWKHVPRGSGRLERQDEDVRARGEGCEGVGV
jgi:hypothetical protein